MKRTQTNKQAPNPTPPLVKLIFFHERKKHLALFASVDEKKRRNRETGESCFAAFGGPAQQQTPFFFFSC